MEINYVHGSVKDKMKLHLCLCEALSYTQYHGNYICERGCWSVTTVNLAIVKVFLAFQE